MSEQKIERSRGMTPAQMEYSTDGIYTTFTFEDGRKTGIESHQQEAVKIMVDAEQDTISLSRESGGMVTVRMYDVLAVVQIAIQNYDLLHKPIVREEAKKPS